VEVSTAMKIQVVVFWVVTPCSTVVGYQRFGELRRPRFEMCISFKRKLLERDFF